MCRSSEVPVEECAAYGQVSVGESHYESVERKSGTCDEK